MKSPSGTNDGLSPKNLAMYGLAKALPGLLMLGSVPLWIRLYGSADYGTFAVIWGASLFSVSLTTGWLRQANLKFSGNAKYRLGNLPPACVLFSVLSSSIAPVIIVWTLRSMQSGENLIALMAASMSFSVASAIYYIALSVAQREQRAAVFTVAEGLRATLSLSASVVVPIIADDYSGTTLVVSNTLGTLLGSAVLFFRRDRTPRDKGASSEILRSFWSYGWPMGLWQAVAAATLYMDRFFITLLLGASAAGTYAALADLLVRGFTILSYPIIMAGHPAIMKTWNSGNRLRAIQLSRVWTFRLGIIVLFGIGSGVLACFFFGEWLLGVEVENSPMLWFLAIGAGSWQLSLMTHKGLEMTGHPRLMLLCLSLLVAATVPVNLLLIPVWGQSMAAASFAFSAVSYCLISGYLSRRVLREHSLVGD